MRVLSSRVAEDGQVQVWPAKGIVLDPEPGHRVGATESQRRDPIAGGLAAP